MITKEHVLGMLTNVYLLRGGAFKIRRVDGSFHAPHELTSNMKHYDYIDAIEDAIMDGVPLMIEGAHKYSTETREDADFFGCIRSNVFILPRSSDIKHTRRNDIYLMPISGKVKVEGLTLKPGQRLLLPKGYEHPIEALENSIVFTYDLTTFIDHLGKTDE